MLYQNLNIVKSTLCFSLREKRKIAAAKARAGKNSFPPTSFLFARPSVQFLEIGVGVLLVESSNFFQ